MDIKCEYFFWVLLEKHFNMEAEHNSCDFIHIEVAFLAYTYYYLLSFLSTHNGNVVFLFISTKLVAKIKKEALYHKIICCLIY